MEHFWDIHFNYTIYTFLSASEAQTHEPKGKLARLKFNYKMICIVSS